MERFLYSALFLVLVFNAPVVCQNKWQTADKATKRLPPVDFPQLPKKIVKALQERGCKIPQAYLNPKPHNVIHGRFAKPNQNDWAVLCSKNRVSSVLIFWGGSTTSVLEILKSPDKNWLQGIGDEKIGFSRAIHPVNKKYILEHYKSYGGTKPPPILYEGIDEGFVGKASTIHYFYRGKWLRLQGAD